MPLYRIKHITRYVYSSPVIDSANQILLYPVNDLIQHVNHHELNISHHPSIEIFNDYYGNRVGLFTILKPHVALNIQSEIEVVINEIHLPNDEVPPAEQWKSLKNVREEFPYIDFLTEESFSHLDELAEEVQSCMSLEGTPFQVAKRMAAFVYDNFEYKQGITTVETKIDEIWDLKAGVCQDFAHILLVMLRMVSIPARYVSGYICPKNHDLRGEGATHAWVEAYIPNYGWIGLDPTNNSIVSDRHVRLAVGRNFSDCTPVKGIYKGPSEHSLEVSVIIENGAVKSLEEAEPHPSYIAYHVQNKQVPVNSYRHFLEKQQQQQQQ